ncbi:hypothetical protein ACWV95_27640 [Streptomyces albus]
MALGGAVLLLSGLLSRPGRILAWVAAALLTAGNGLGLVWRGYHWPLDVAASWCLGALLLGAVAAVARPGHLPYGTPAAGDDRRTPNRRAPAERTPTRPAPTDRTPNRRTALARRETVVRQGRHPGEGVSCRSPCRPCPSPAATGCASRPWRRSGPATTG